VLSLFSGVAGLDLGLRVAFGARTVCHVEREAYCAAVILARMEDSSLEPAPIWCGDVREFDGREWRGRVDAVAAGWPCQPFSVAGKRGGESDERHLWPEVLRVLRESEAGILFGENVPGHVSLGFAGVLGDLAALGFDAEWGCFTASEAGAPHRRERLFVLAYTALGRERLRLRLGTEERAGAESGAEGRGADVADTGRPDGGRQDERREPLGRDAAAGSGTGVADAEECGHDRAGSARRGRPEPAGEGIDVAGADGCDTGLAQPERPGLEGRERGVLEEPGEGRPDADAGGSGLPPWPPGPVDFEGWHRVLAVRPDLAPALPAALDHRLVEAELSRALRVRATGRNRRARKRSARRFAEALMGTLRAPLESAFREHAHGLFPGMDRAMSNRADRLRALGNAVVPAQAALAFRELAARVLAALSEEPKDEMPLSARRKTR
jgi:DNA (cytosine-5)-methyltransferase 1